MKQQHTYKGTIELPRWAFALGTWVFGFVVGAAFVHQNLLHWHFLPH